jgi:sec-independent protein translocase protein TatB
MFDIGLGEIAIIAVVGLLVFGPDKLPKAAADTARMLRNLRAMATSARRDLVDAAGLDTQEAQQTMRDLRQFHPKNLVGDLFTDDDASPSGKAAPSGPGAPSSQDSRGVPRSSTFDPDAT